MGSLHLAWNLEPGQYRLEVGKTKGATTLLSRRKNVFNKKLQYTR